MQSEGGSARPQSQTEPRICSRQNSPAQGSQTACSEKPGTHSPTCKPERNLFFSLLE